MPVVGGRTNSNEETTGSKAKVVLARQWRVRQGFGEVSGYVNFLPSSPPVFGLNSIRILERQQWQERRLS